MKNFRLAKPTKKQQIGLAIMGIVIITTLIATSFMDLWMRSKTEIRLAAIGYILIVGFSILDRKYWLLILLPIWFVVTMPGSDWVNIEISNYSAEPCQATLTILPDCRTKNFSISPADTAKITAPWANQFILTYQYPNQPEQSKLLQRPANKNTIKTHLDQPTSKPTKTKAQIEAYLKSCPRGYPVSDIEAHLNLPEPSETEAPAFGWSYWKYRYFVDDLVVYFLADNYSDDQDKFFYVGKPEVWRASDYWYSLSHKVPKAKENKPGWVALRLTHPTIRFDKR